jgi:hypothetical protein
MTATLDAAPVRRDRPDRPRAAAPVSRRTRLRDWWHAHRLGAAYVVPLLALTAVARLVNLGGAPQRIDDEGTYTAQAWAVETLGELGHYTYWYDHPPLGWIQIAGWTSLTGAFGRHDVAVLAAREAMVVAAVVSAGLLWLLGRRLGLGRPAASVAVVLFAVSPIALQYGRTVYLDNVAVPWLLASFVLALSRRHQLAAFAGSALCFSIAVLTKETFLLVLPFLAWQMWRSADPRTRRYTLSVAGAVLALTTFGYLLFALVKGEVMPGEDRVSLWEGITFQLVNRDSSGSVLEASSQAGRTVRGWLELDAVLLIAGLVAALVAVWVRRLRPYAALALVMTLVVFKPGYLPVPFVIVLLPFAALLVAAVLDAAVRRSRGTAVLAAVSAVAVAVSAVALWPGQLRFLWGEDLDRPLQQAEAWVAGNVGPDDQVLVDDAAWVDLVRAGLPRENVVWYYKADTDSDVFSLYPNGWQDYEFALVTEGMRQSTGTSPLLDDALQSGLPVASFGEGPEEVQVYRLLPAGLDAFYAADYNDERGRLAAGQALLGNTALSFGTDAAAALQAGSVDSRIVTTLARFASRYDLTVDAFPVVAGEEGSDLARRTMTVSSVDGGLSAADVARLTDDLDAQTGALAGARVETSAGALTVTFPVAAPEYLLPTPAQ